MHGHSDPVHHIQRRITGQIGALADALPHCALSQFVEGVDDIRRLARDHGFAMVETLASGSNRRWRRAASRPRSAPISTR